MFDFHVHTCYSDDCSIPMEEYILPAIQKGLKGICFTDHIDIDYPNQMTKFHLEYDNYMNEVKRLKEKYHKQIEVLAGIEFGMQPHILDTDISFFSGKDFDYVIGSLHTANRKELYGGDFTQGITEREGIESYFEDMLYCTKHFNSFKNLGHIDAIRRYLSNKGEGFQVVDYMDYIEEILKTLIHKNKGIELNTSGKRYGLPHFHPEPSIIKRYRQLGGEIITLGSDSHNPRTLGYGFAEALDMLSSLGFRYHTIYRNGKAEFLKI